MRLAVHMTLSGTCAQCNLQWNGWSVEEILHFSHESNFLNLQMDFA